MVRIFVDHDVVTVPIPIVAVGQVEIGYAEAKATEPEAAGIASLNAPAVATAESAIEATILPRVIDAKAGVISAAIVSHPFAVAVDVRRLGMTLAVVEVSVAIIVMVGFVMVAIVRVAMVGRRPVARDVSATDVTVTVAVIAMVVMLRESRQG